jgi:general stress protein YciG
MNDERNESRDTIPSPPPPVTQETEPPKRRGFASMSSEERRRIASLGGKAAHAQGKGHQFTPEEAREAGRKGGTAVRRKLGAEHMRAIGRLGGKKSHAQPHPEESFDESTSE